MWIDEPVGKVVTVASQEIRLLTVKVEYSCYYNVYVGLIDSWKVRLLNWYMSKLTRRFFRFETWLARKQGIEGGCMIPDKTPLGLWLRFKHWPATYVRKHGIEIPGPEVDYL